MATVSKALSETQLEFVNALAENRGEHVLTPSGVEIGERLYRRNTITAVETRGILKLRIVSRRGKRVTLIELTSAGWQAANAQRPAPIEAANEPIILQSAAPKPIKIEVSGHALKVRSGRLQLNVFKDDTVDVTIGDTRTIVVCAYRLPRGAGWTVREFGARGAAEVFRTVGEGLAKLCPLQAGHALDVDRMVAATNDWMKAHPAPRIIFEGDVPPPPAIALPVPSPSPVPQLDAAALPEPAEAETITVKLVGIFAGLETVAEAAAGEFKIRVSISGVFLDVLRNGRLILTGTRLADGSNWSLDDHRRAESFYGHPTLDAALTHTTLSAPDAAEILRLWKAADAYIDALPRPRIIIEDEEPAPVALPIPAPRPAPQLRAVACAAPCDPKVTSGPVDVRESLKLTAAEGVMVCAMAKRGDAVLDGRYWVVCCTPGNLATGDCFSRLTGEALCDRGDAVQKDGDPESLSLTDQGRALASELCRAPKVKARRRRVMACAAPRDPKVTSAPVDEVTESRQVRRAEKRAAEKKASEAVQRRGYNSRNAKFVPTSLNSAAVETDTPAWVRSPGERERWRAVEKNVSILIGARTRIALPTFYRVPDKYGCVGIDGEFRRPGDRAAARWNATAAITHETWDAFGTLAAYDAHGMRRPQDWYRFRDRALGYLARAMGTDDIRTFEQTHDHAAVLAAFDHAIGESVHDAASGHFAPWYRS